MDCPNEWTIFTGMTDELRKFLLKSKGYFSFATIEAATGIPEGSISKALRELPSRKLSEDQEAAVRKYMATVRKELDKIAK